MRSTLSEGDFNKLVTNVSAAGPAINQLRSRGIVTITESRIRLSDKFFKELQQTLESEQFQSFLNELDKKSATCTPDEIVLSAATIITLIKLFNGLKLKKLFLYLRIVEILMDVKLCHDESRLLSFSGKDWAKIIEEFRKK